jgi:hypothetical protein
MNRKKAIDEHRRIPSLQVASNVCQKPRLEHIVRENVRQNDAETVQMWNEATKPE